MMLTQLDMNKQTAFLHLIGWLNLWEVGHRDLESNHCFLPDILKSVHKIFSFCIQSLAFLKINGVGLKHSHVFEKPQVKCDICQQLLSDKRSLRRHRKNIHKIYPQSNSFECDECGFSTKSLFEQTGHMTVQHDAPNSRYCLYCNKCFHRDFDCLEHMNGVHGLPAWNMDSENLQRLGILPTERDFGSALKT